MLLPQLKKRKKKLLLLQLLRQLLRLLLSRLLELPCLLRLPQYPRLLQQLPL